MIVIGHRKSGKTNTLIRDVIEYLERNLDKRAHIVSRDVLEERIMRNIPEKFNRRITFSGSMEYNVKNFVDEFDYLPEKDLIVDENNNYYGTLNKTGLSKFHQILEAHDERVS